MKPLNWLAPLTAATSYAAWQFVARQVCAAGLPPLDLHLYAPAQAKGYLAGRLGLCPARALAARGLRRARPATPKP